MSKTQAKNDVCWSHVGTFFALGRLFFALGWFLNAFRTFWLMLVVFFGLRVTPGSILGGLDKVLEPSKPPWTMFFGIRKHASQKCSSCNKTTVFAMFYKLPNVSHTATKRGFCIALKAFLHMVHGLLQKVPAGIHWAFGESCRCTP